MDQDIEYIYRMLRQNDEYLDGIFKFNIILFFVNLLFILQFFVSWCGSYQKTGWKIDVWHFAILTQFVIPVLLMYPFSASPLNVVSMGHHYYNVEPYVSIAYIITITGYMSLILGGYYSRIFLKKSALYFLIGPMKGFCKVIYRVVDSFSFFYYLYIPFLVVMIFFLALQIQYGYLGDPRSYAMANPQHRPFYNAILTVSPMLVTFIALRYLMFNKKTEFFLLVILLLFSIFLGTRGAILGPVLSVIMLSIYSKKGRVSIAFLIFTGLFLVTVAIILGSWRRDGDITLSFQTMLVDAIYGNSFSDTRDFAWILAYWDYEYILGKTYLSGLISFIPSEFSDFRMKWSLSRYTNTFVGFDSSIHPGLRPGSFGEVFFNFGIFGVVALGFVAGYVLMYSDTMMKHAIETKNNILLGYTFMFPYTVVSSFFITAGFWTLYIYVFLVTALYILLLISPKKINTNQNGRHIVNSC